MQFRAEEYYRAGLERLRQAKSVYSRGSGYALVIYSGGLAVECLLRAFRWNVDNSFEGRHDLSELLKASGILRVDEEYLRRRGKAEEVIRQSSLEFRAAMNEVVVLWHNNLRFASEARLRAHLIQINRVQGIKGDPVKKNAADFLNAAQLVVNKGMVLWESQKRL